MSAERSLSEILGGVSWERMKERYTSIKNNDSEGERRADAKIVEGLKGLRLQIADDFVSPVQIAVVPASKKAANTVESVNESAVIMKVRPPETERNGELRSSAELPDGTSLTAEQTMSINLTQSRGPVDEVQPPKSSECERIQTMVLPWTKGELLGAGSFGTVYEAVDRKSLPKYETRQRVVWTGETANKPVPPEDGYTWRKYGQKDIKESQFPRSYYRCTHKTELGCPASKTVHRCDQDPEFYVVIYKGNHICPPVERHIIQMTPENSTIITKGNFFAVKEVSLVDIDSKASRQLEQEIEFLSGLKHDNIVQYLGTERADGKLYIFLELVSKGSLASLCKKKRLTYSHIMAFTRQILKGLKYLHDMNVVHRDVKCANILVDVKGTCKLAYFGLAKHISALDELKSCKGSAYWMAPEVIDPKKSYSFSADIWSLGCSVLEMFTGSPPFGDQEWYRVLWRVGHGDAPPIPDHLSEEAKDFIRQCLKIDPSKRPSAKALLQHRFLSASTTPTDSIRMNPQLVDNSLHMMTEGRTGNSACKNIETDRSSLSDENKRREDKRRREEAGEGTSAKRQTRGDKTRQEPPPPEVPMTDVPTSSEKEKKLPVKEKGKGPAYKLQSDIEAATDLNKCVEVNSSKRHTDTERVQHKFPVISPPPTMSPETSSSQINTTNRDMKKSLEANQRDCLPVHSTGPLPYVSCQHCRVLLKIPSKLLQTLQCKPEAKLRCAACQKVSLLSGLSPEPPGSRDAGIATFSSKSRTTEGSCAVPRLDNEGATTYSASSTDEASSTSCPSTDAEVHSSHDARSSLPSISAVQSFKKTVKISGSSNVDFYRELQSDLQARRNEGAGSGLIELANDKLIVGLSQTCAKWEMREASGSLMDVGFITEMDGDRSQWQAASSCACPPLRPDVLAFGFKTFHDVYDPTRLLCCYHVLGDAVEILFFHVQGMAAFIGIGLPFSRVLLREDLTVEISELRLQTWLDCWSEQEMANFTLLLYDSTEFENQQRRTSVSGVVQPLSAEQAAEQFGIGTQGESLVMLPVDAFQRVLPDSRLVPPSWIGSFYQSLRVAGKGGGTKSETPGNASNDTPPSQTLSGSLQHSSSSDLVESSKRAGEQEIESLREGKELAEVGVLDHERRNQPLQLSVIIYLDGDSCTYYNAVDKSEFRLDRESAQLRFVHSGTEDVIMDIDPILCEFVIVPKLTVDFLYYPHLEGNGSKKMKTSLDVEFLIDGNVSDPDEFGWYHDQLRVSFKCTRPNEARREETEIISRNEMRTADRGYGRENSTLSLKGKGKEGQVFAGHKSFASLQFNMTSKEESSTGFKMNLESSIKISARCLADASFSLQQKGGAAELAYLATIFPPFHLYEVWDPVDRDLAQSSGIMSAVPLKISAGWTIREDESNSDDRFCKYELSCQRDLKVLRRTHVERPSVVRKGFFSRSRHRPEVIIDIEEKSITVQQKLGRSFLVNHSFSHMQRLLQPYPYQWNMMGRPQAPCPRPADQMIH